MSEIASWSMAEPSDEGALKVSGSKRKEVLAFDDAKEVMQKFASGFRAFRPTLCQDA